MNGGAAGVPFGHIKRLFGQGAIVPFLGAGASRDAQPPLPLGGQLAEALARESGLEDLLKAEPNMADYAKQWILRDLPRVASYCSGVAMDAESLNDYLEKAFGTESNPCPIHEFIAEAARQKPLLVITTNYDSLVEKAFNQKNTPYTLVVHPVHQTGGDCVYVRAPGANDFKEEDPRTVMLELGQSSIVYKMHGSYALDAGIKDNYLITEEDYVEFLARMDVMVPHCFQETFRKSKFLFLGYGLGDWNFRLMLHNIRQRSMRANQGGEARSRHWAIQYHPSQMDKAIWISRGINVYDILLSDFVEGLRAENAG
jgi:NAD-dependent SIR2 family protein deacetylase